MSADFRRKSAAFVLACALLVCAFAAWSGAASKPEPSPYDDEEYKEIIAQRVGDIYGLEAWAAAVQDDFMPILPPVPELILRQSGYPEVLPFTAKSFPPAFVSGVAGIYENSVPVYPVLVVEDPATRALTFYNLDNQAVYTLPAPAGYDPFAFLRSRWPGLFTGAANDAARQNMMQLYDPARIQVRAKLVEADQLALWIYTKRQIEAAQALKPGGAVELKMMLGGAPNSNIFFTVVKRATNYVSMTIQHPSGFTNGLDVFTCNDLMAEVWGFGAKGLATTGTNVTWVDTNAWVVAGFPTRLYAAADAATDGDGDGYADGREIMVYGTDPMSASSHPVTVSGTVSYGGIETGGVYVLFTQDAGSWSIAKSLWMAGPAAYTNDEVGNGQDWWFKAFRDSNGNFSLDPWEARGTYSSSSTYVTGSLTGVDIAVADVPSIWGQIDYSGGATGDIHVIAVTGSNSWDQTYSTTIPYVQGDDGSGGVYYVTFPVNYTLTGLPASNYWIRAFMDTDTNGVPSSLDPAGQYSSNSIPVSNRVTGVNVTAAYDSDGDGLPDWWEMQNWSDLSQTNSGDADGDGLSNSNEVAAGTNPNSRDTDGDGVPDPVELTIGSSATSADPVVDVAPGDASIAYRSQSVHAWKEGYMEFGYSYATSPLPPRVYLSYSDSNSTSYVLADWSTTAYRSESKRKDTTLRREHFRKIEDKTVELYVGDYDPMPGSFEWRRGSTWTFDDVCAGCFATNYYSEWWRDEDGWHPYPGDVTNSWSCGQQVAAGLVVTNDVVTNTATERIWQNVTTNSSGNPVTSRRREWLDEEVSTAQLTNMAASELTALGDIASLAWNTGVLWQGVCSGSNFTSAAAAAARCLSEDEVTSDVTRIQYRVAMTSTSTGIVYRATVLHLFTAEGASTSAIYGVTNLWAKGTGGAAIFMPTNGVTVEPPGQDGVVSPIILKVDIAMDGNRDDSIDFGSTNDNHCLFWLNDDVDVISDGEEDDADSGAANCDDNVITCKRDLEDFTRLHIEVDENTAHLSGITYFLKFESSGSPSVNIFEAVGESSAYLSDTNVANQQILKTNLLTVTTTEHQLPNQYIKTNGAVSPFILEGNRAGTGALTVIVKKDGNEVCRKALALDLRPITEFCEKYVVTISTGDDVNTNSGNNANSTTYTPENDEYVLHVHGWNMENWEKDRWTETVFKRLWWQRYKGRVGGFQWPTLGALYYDRSEIRAWNSAQALNDRITSLNASYSGQVRVIAHSMGNVVMGEALRLFSSSVVHTYIAAQAAIPAHCYDNAVSNYWTGFDTPDVYARYSSGLSNDAPYLAVNSNHAGAMSTYFNMDDYALGWWETGNEMKPDVNYWYTEGDANVDSYAPASGDRFYYDSILPSDERTMTIPTNRFEIFARIVESRSRALGREASVAGFGTARDLHSWGYDNQHYSHSREFRSNVADEWSFWDAFFGDAGLTR
jgi:hypothetical protein